jgi:hypothetical protein
LNRGIGEEREKRADLIELVCSGRERREDMVLWSEIPACGRRTSEE